MFVVRITKKFNEEFKRLNKLHKDRIIKMIRRLESEGLNAVKILTNFNNFILCEMKSHKPPYRLYIIYDQGDKIFYVFKWEHKDKQEEFLSQLNASFNEAIIKIMKELRF